MKTSKYDLTSNQYFGGLNTRFDKRAAQLHRFGFKYQTTEFGMAMFVRSHPWRCSTTNNNGETVRAVQAVPASMLTYADSRAWNHELSTMLRRGFTAL